MMQVKNAPSKGQVAESRFKEEDYKSDWEAPITRIVDDWGLRYPGVKKSNTFTFTVCQSWTIKPERGISSVPTGLAKSLSKLSEQREGR